MIENLSVTVRQTFATVPMRKIHHTTVIDWGWVGRVEVRGVEVGGGGVGESGSGGWGELGTPQPRSPDLTPPTSPPPTPTPLTSTPLTPTFPTQPPTPIQHRILRRIFRIGTVANVCPTVMLKFSVTFVVWRIFCGECSGNRP